VLRCSAHVAGFGEAGILSLESEHGTADRRPRLLFVLHSFHIRAGTEEHTRILAEALCDRFEIAYLFPERGAVVLRIHDAAKEIRFPGGELRYASPHDPVVAQSVKDALREFPPELIHIQHFARWPRGVIDLLAELGRPLVMSFHDYFAITPLFMMIGTEDPDVVMSESYVRKYFGADVREGLQERQGFLRRSLQAIRVRIVPSRFLASVMAKVYPNDYRVIPHGVRPFAEPVARHSGGALRFGYLGGPVLQKGWQELLRAWPLVSDAAPAAELHLFGGRSIRGELPRNAFHHGGYSPVELPRILSQIDVGVLPSICPETFSLVLSEMQLAGIPVAASRMGAFRERVREGETGYFFDPFSPDDTARALRLFTEDDGWRGWNIPSPRLAEQMADEYAGIYRSLS
jgi:glycosyltransferase involved in cell wall biosynthesis